MWKVIMSEPRRKKANDLNVTVIPRKQKEGEKVVIAVRLYGKY
jgi:hypothetical protein